MTSPDKPTRIALVEDDPQLTDVLRRVLDTAPDLECVACCPSGEICLSALPPLHPEIILMDLNLPGISGIETTRLLKQKMPAAEIIVITIYREYERVFQALQAGAVGYILKHAGVSEILRAITEVKAGGAPMSPEIARRIVHTFQHAPAAAAPPPDVHLTPREREILDSLSRGLANKEIADLLGVTPHTIADRLKGIYQKLHVRSRTEAAALYQGWPVK
ncbi:MAG: response regulator transcription factor [Verrucomicrobiota bacterium]